MNLNQAWSVSKNKNVEVQFNCGFPSSFKLVLSFCLSVGLRRIHLEFLGVSFTYSRCEDHAGLSFLWQTPWTFLAVSFYDSRHWNYENHRWEIYQ